MANEAILNWELAHPVPFTVANATGIEKGTLLKLTDPKTAIISSAANDACCGIAAAEKIASNGVTELAVFQKGIFEMLASGAITVGAAVRSTSDANYPNTVGSATGITAASGAAIIGYALET